MNRPHLLLGALLVSLALNLLCAGLFFGRALRHPDPPPPMAWAMRDVDEQTTARLRPLLREQLTEVRPLRMQIRSAMRVFAEVVAEEPFDAAAAAEALAALRQTSVEYQQVMHRDMLRILEGLQPEERMAVVRILLHRGGRTHGRDAPARRSPPAAAPGVPSPAQ